MQAFAALFANGLHIAMAVATVATDVTTCFLGKLRLACMVYMDCAPCHYFAIDPQFENNGFGCILLLMRSVYL